jgi:hypothetical protein
MIQLIPRDSMWFHWFHVILCDSKWFEHCGTSWFHVIPCDSSATESAVSPLSVIGRHWTNTIVYQIMSILSKMAPSSLFRKSTHWDSSQAIGFFSVTDHHSIADIKHLIQERLHIRQDRQVLFIHNEFQTNDQKILPYFESTVEAYVVDSMSNTLLIAIDLPTQNRRACLVDKLSTAFHVKKIIEWLRICDWSSTFDNAE